MNIDHNDADASGETDLFDIEDDKVQGKGGPEISKAKDNASWFDFSDYDEVLELNAPACAAANVESDEEKEQRRVGEETKRWPPELIQPLGVGKSIFAKTKPDWPKFEFLCRDLGITIGAPTLLVGYGYSGKTFLVQALAICVATGAPFLGKFAVSKGEVVHLDYEQGEPLSRARFYRLLGGMKLPVGSLDCGALVYHEHPKLRLDDDGAEELLCKRLEGKKLCVIDSLRAAVSATVDENSASFRQSLDVLSRVSSATKCCFVVLHHTGKNAGSDKLAPRGSSAIFDAAATVLLLDPPPPNDDRRDHFRLTQTKTRSRLFKGISYRLFDEGDDIDAIDASEALALRPVPDGCSGPRYKILDALRDGPLRAGLLDVAVGGKDATRDEALNQLQDEGWVVATANPKDGRVTMYELTSEGEKWLKTLEDDDGP